MRHTCETYELLGNIRKIVEFEIDGIFFMIFSKFVDRTRDQRFLVSRFI